MKINILLLMLVVLFSACKNDDNKNYSEDPVINSWVKENKSKFKGISLDEIASYKGEEQRAIFRSLTPENQKQLWLEKSNKLLVMYPEQKEIFQDFDKFLKQKDFKTGLENNEIVFLFQLIEKGKKDYNWDEEFIGITFCTFEFVNDTHEQNIFKFLDDSFHQGGTRKPICNCKWGGMFACGAFECRGIECRDDGKKGCGFLLLEHCTAVCR